VIKIKVELVDYTPDGINKIARLARATRLSEIERKELEPDISTPGILKWGETDETKTKNENFVKALIKVKHLGILEHINFTFHVSEISRVTSHQLVRHRIGFSYLQMSNRHAKPKMNDYVLPQSIKNRDSLLTNGRDKKIEHRYRLNMMSCWEDYNWMIKNGVPIEDARYVLPPAFFTHISITCNARSLLHFLELRLDRSAQAEIRELACKLFDAVYELYPIIFESVKELRDNANL